MKKIYFFLAFLVVGLSAKAAPAAIDFRNPYGYKDAFIFVEGGVEFAIFPDGQFDFFFDPHQRNPRFGGRNPFSFNDGFDYGPFVQYDDFGAVIQIERVPIYYDFYGRIVQAGNVPIFYNQFGTVSQIGHLYLTYDRFGRYTHYSGYVNARNRFYSHKPWHRYYRRPPAHSVVVFHQPYRAYYHPHRFDYSYYKNKYRRESHTDFRRNYYRPGDQVTEYYRGKRTETPRKDYADHSENTRSNQNSVRQEERNVRPVRTSSFEQSDRNSRDMRTDVPDRVENSVQQRNSRIQRQVPQRNIPGIERNTERSVRSSSDSAPQVKAAAPERVRPVGERSSRGRN